ncbi:penicillin-binding protein 1C [Desulfoluna spongiiphila]|uniref:penicillin-binding protein 1C n=1 Tax=Desulfoluna spongiiphila TaxID=419481 RepID=UPI00125607F7|nr:penicillin-binding protein 1C [Desulfoluna spongiiphila]VVS94987.1 penicillin-binding protein 1c [Desulfoluna spongiiphila]
MARVLAIIKGTWRLAVLACAVVLAVCLDLAFPPDIPAPGEGMAVTVVDREGSPLRVFPDDRGIWRYPVTLEEVSPIYIEALLAYEDRWFYRHPGVNPLAMARALADAIRHGRIVSGGSTLTMQVARILHPHRRTVAGKIGQMLRALQLERRLTKEEILTLYLNHAPFGGTVEGVQAASLTYLGKPAAELTHAEAALLAVLPQAPSRYRPDLHPDRAVTARNKVIRRLVGFGRWEPWQGEEARDEPLAVQSWKPPFRAPLLARRLRRACPGQGVIQTPIDPSLQAGLADLAVNLKGELPSGTSVAFLVVENDTGLVRGYKGSMDFFDEGRFGHVDMVRAVRSPGSTLKPFLYAVALDEGLIHSESLLMDSPLSIGGYTPLNFTRHFSGPVSAADALVRSLNVPAVDLLDRVGPVRFDSLLRQAGIHLRYPEGGEPNLAMVLGGVGTTLEELVAGFSAFARGGRVMPLGRLSQARGTETQVLSEGAAWIIRRILETPERNRNRRGRFGMRSNRKLAWKTGTSYGFRDAWAVGITDTHTLGVWVGRPDGTPLPGHYGAVTAVPILFQVADRLPPATPKGSVMPASVSRETVCWPLGVSSSDTEPGHCHVKRTAWVLNDTIPPTFASGREDTIMAPNPLVVSVNPDNGKGLYGPCLDRWLATHPDRPHIPTRTIARWPAGAIAFLPPWIRDRSRFPDPDLTCLAGEAPLSAPITIHGTRDGAVLKDPLKPGQPLTVELCATGGSGPLHWMIDHTWVSRSRDGVSARITFPTPGRHTLTVMDASGRYADLSVVVR